jgi:hypothetical protein
LKDFFKSKNRSNHVCKSKPQNLFYLKRKKASSDGKVPVYVRITIDGLKDETSLGIKITPENWDNDLKKVSSQEAGYKVTNKKIDQSRTDLGRHFDLIKAQHEIARPSMVISAYRSPVNGENIRNQQARNDQLNQGLDVSRKPVYRSFCKSGKSLSV